METSVRMVARVRILAATSGVSALAVTMATPAATVSYLFDDCNICRLQKITYPFKKKEKKNLNIILAHMYPSTYSIHVHVHI